MRRRLIDRTPFRHEHLVEINLEPEPGRHQRFQREDEEQPIATSGFTIAPRRDRSDARARPPENWQTIGKVTALILPSDQPN